MKQLLLLVSLILLGLLAPKEIYKEQPSLADPNNPLSLTCPEYIPTEHSVNANLNFAKPDNRLKNVDQNWYSAAVENIMKEEYNISYSEEIGSYQSPNRANNLRFTYHKDGFIAKPHETKIPRVDVNDRTLRDDEKKYEEIGDWSIELKVENGKWKVDDNEMRIANAGSPPSGGARGGEIEDNSLKAAGNKAWIEDDNIKIDYTNSKQGMRQDFIIKHKPEGDGNLEIVMNASTELQMNLSKDAVKFSSAAGEKMQYASLKAWDANGKNLDAYFENIDEKQFAIMVDDSDAEYPVTVDPLSSTPDWVREGFQDGDKFSHSVSSAGDLNQDGFSDVIIGSPGFSNGQTREGKVYVYFGSPIGLSSNSGWTFESDENEAQFGYCVSEAGDINNDGYSDLIIGSPFYSNGQLNEGKVYVFFGSGSGLSNSPNWVYESNTDTAKAGFSVSSAGDFNSDGYDDVIIGCPGYGNNYLNACGRVLIFLSSSSGISDTANYTVRNMLNGYTGLGTAVSLAGDANADGYSDILYGEPYWPCSNNVIGNNFENPGSVSVVYGISSGEPNVWSVHGEADNALFGYSVSGAGDINGDGFDEAAVGSPTVNTCYVYKGSLLGYSDQEYWRASDPNAYSRHITNIGLSVCFAGDVNSDGFSDLITSGNWENNEYGTAIFVYYGSVLGFSISAEWVYFYSGNRDFGGTVSNIDDVNGDGYSDVIIGMRDYSGIPDRPSAEIFFGGQTTLRIKPDWVAPDEGEDYFVGRSVSSAGDVNGDGFDDFLIGSPVEYNSQSTMGRAHVYWGGLSVPGQVPNWTAVGGREFGSVVSGAGDFNNDGFDDVLIADPAYVNGERRGKVYLYLGSPVGLNTIPSWTETSPGTGGSFGSSISGAGDVNGDGYSDIVIGTGDYQIYGSRYVGAYVYLGNSSGVPNNQPSWTASSTLPLEGFGKSVSIAGDVNGDGYDDVIVSAYKYSEVYTGGDAFLFFGRQQKSIYDPFDWHVQSDSGFGYAVSDAGDIDGDGFDDIMISAIFENDYNGRVYFFKGSSDGPQLIADWQITGIIQSLFGTEIACAGDYNHDGFSDIIIGELHGNAYLFYGSRTSIGQSMETRFRGGSIHSVSGSMDINGDNNSDVIIGMLYNPNNNYGRNTAGLYLGKNDRLSVFPKRSIYSQNEQVCINSILSTASGSPVENFTIVFEIKGANQDTADVTTNELGKAAYCFLGVNWGIDTVIVKAGNVIDTAFVIWDFPSPVELLSFNSNVHELNVILSWSTSTELNNSGFEIQRAIENGKWKVENGKWSKIGFVNGNGTTNEPREYTFTDRNLETGKYKYRLKQLDFNGNFEYFELAEVVSIGIPDNYDLSQNYPNPFNPVTTINYDLPTDGIVTIKVYDILGREMKTLVNEMKTAGYHKIQFNVADLASGAYFYQMKAGDFVAVKKFVVLK